MKLLIGLLVPCTLSACGSVGSPSEPVVEETGSGDSSSARIVAVVTSADQLDQYVGEVITIQGVVSNTKIPTILGVDVGSFDPDLRGQLAQASGLLQKTLVTEEQVAGADSANRGAGTFYRLEEIHSDHEAAARPWRPDPAGQTDRPSADR